MEVDGRGLKQLAPFQPKTASERGPRRRVGHEHLGPKLRYIDIYIYIYSLDPPAFWKWSSFNSEYLAISSLPVTLT